jgi:hypothetical protein
LERACIWRYLWHAVEDGKFSSLKFLELVKTQIPTETVEQTIVEALGRLSVLIKNFIPSEM